MDACEPRVRRRGFFLDRQDTGEPEGGEQEVAEGFTVRVRIIRPRLQHQVGGASSPAVAQSPSRRRAHTSSSKSAIATATHQRSRSPR